MTDDHITKEDLRQFGLLLLNNFRELLPEQPKPVNDPNVSPEWLKSSKVKKLLDMSAGTLQNLRITGKVRFKKVMGAYYYNKADLQKMFTDK